MSSEALVSVVIPIYNVEKHLRRCIESIRNQSYEDLEIILVDDGSPDSCGEICESYRILDARIKVIHKLNAGLGYARNSGLDIATGKYVVFVDSDDYVKQDYIEAMVDRALVYQADLVTCGFIRKFTDNSEKEVPIVAEECVYKNGEILPRVILPVIGSVPESNVDVEREMCVWINLYRKEIIDQNSIRFVSERDYVSEDFFFNITYFHKVKTAVLLPRCLYYYSENPGSLTNSFRTDRFEKYCKMYIKQKEILSVYNYLPYADKRLARTFLMKSKKSIASVEASKLKFSDKIKQTNKILKNNLFKQVINTYPVDKYSGSPKLAAILMKYKLSVPILLLYRVKRMKELKGSL